MNNQCSASPAFVSSSAATFRVSAPPSSGLRSICGTCPSVRAQAAARKRARVTMGLFGLGAGELLVIAGLGVLVFGPSKISELGKDLGGIAGGVKKASAEFKDAMQESIEEADKEIEKKKLERESPAGTTTTVSSTAVSDETDTKSSST